MAALSADRKLTNAAETTSRYRYHKVATNVIIYKGAAICVNAGGFVVPGANTAGLKFLGWAAEYVDNTGGANGAKEVKYFTAWSVKMKNEATALVAQANLGTKVWLHDDQTVRGTAGNGVVIGIAEQIEADGEVLVYGAPELA